MNRANGTEEMTRMKKSRIGVLAKIFKMVVLNAPFAVSVHFIHSVVEALMPAVVNITLAGTIDGISRALTTGVGLAEAKNLVVSG